ncbi:hypothetical protein HanRHA438_Chr09g0411561 [Helianthus annuus]|nr:hypothetical protein HanRHA438_Chr09g0411561 [Helianthus annuus]
MNKIVGPSYKSVGNHTSVANIGLDKEVLLSKAHWLPTVKGMLFDAPFDPGGTCQVLSETTREVVQFGWGVIIVIQVRVDVPYDPGGFCPKVKLGDEFFF